MLQALVFLAEIATATFFVVFCLMIASDGVRGPVFEIKVQDPIGRVLIRNAQIAFVIGYSAFFASTFAIAFDFL